MAPYPYDPVILDPPTIDYRFPAAMIPLIIDSDGAKLNGMMYLASGAGPHPTAILLHGFPGVERNLDVAQAIRRAGWNVLYFHYRGSWGSAGSYSQQHTVEDALVALEFLRSKGATDYRVDPEMIALIGHSMGGACAFAAAIQEPSIHYIASLAGVNWERWASLKQNDPTAFENLAATLDANSAPLPGFNGRKFLDEVIENHERYDVKPNAEILAARKMLLVGGLRDEATPVDMHHWPMLHALQDRNASQLTHHLFDDDHVFSNHRIALTRLIISWLTELR